MTDRDVCFTPAATLVRLFRSGKLSPVEVTKAVLGRIEAVNHSLNAYRGARQAAAHAEKLPKWRDVMQDDLVKNIEYGLTLTANDIGRCERTRTALYHRVRTFFETYDLIIAPTTSVQPFPVEMPYPAEVDGRPMTSYIEWLLPTYAFTVVGLPAITVPCGFTRDGLPVGLQIAGPWRGEATVLRAAAAYEAAQPWGQHSPPAPGGSGID